MPPKRGNPRLKGFRCADVGRSLLSFRAEYIGLGGQLRYRLQEPFWNLGGTAETDLFVPVWMKRFFCFCTDECIMTRLKICRIKFKIRRDRHAENNGKPLSAEGL